MKVFLAHKLEDRGHAEAVAQRLKTKHGVAYYLDVHDPDSKSVEDIAEHLREHMDSCTNLMAVVSEKTKASWWVPWEIGIATEKILGISTFAAGRTALPGYLEKWPYLLTIEEVDKYVEANRQANVLIESRARTMGKVASALQGSYPREFHRVLRGLLGR